MIMAFDESCFDKEWVQILSRSSISIIIIINIHHMIPRSSFPLPTPTKPTPRFAPTHGSWICQQPGKCFVKCLHFLILLVSELEVTNFGTSMAWGCRHFGLRNTKTMLEHVWSNSIDVGVQAKTKKTLEAWLAETEKCITSMSWYFNDTSPIVYCSCGRCAA